MVDTTELESLNGQFIDAFRRGSWEMLAPILTTDFVYLDGASGQTWELERYEANLRSHPVEGLAYDQVAIHVSGDNAVVSARTHRPGGSYGRYVDSYRREEGVWRCFHACVWPLL
jgi:hypothetical protein